MRAYIIRRLLLIIPTLLVVSIMVFISIRLVPGSIIDLMVAQHGGGGDLPSSSGMAVNPDAIRSALGLDVPFYVQFGRWVRDIFLHGNLGTSLWTQTTVTKELVRRIPVTFELGLLAFIIAELIAIPVGIFSAIRQDTLIDHVSRSAAIVGLAVPSFWLATMVMVYPSVWWTWSPPMQYIPFSRDPIGNLGMMIIPAIILGTAMAGATMRYMRTMMLDVLKEDYVRTAWAKGLKERVVVLRHALRNAVLPVVTILMGQITVMISGSVIIEQIFNLPGMGRLLLDVLLKRDYLMVSGLNLSYALLGLVLILITDLSYAYLDPRIRYR
jgi:peptide/nickel transport system permease protein